MAIYLDYAATVPMSPEVLAVYTDALAVVGNPSSIHSFGQSARQMVEEAREGIALAVNADRNEVIFTSGGTEANNLAIKGLFWERNRELATRKKIVSAYTEHHAVTDTIEWLEKHEGAEPIWAPVSENGEIDFDWYRSYLSENANEIALVTFMLANNETGIITDVRNFAREANKHDIPSHSDAVAAFGYLPINFSEIGLSTMAISAHKVGGPVGVGALIVSRSTKITSLMQGGGQERGIRSGTLNAAGNRAFAFAAEKALDSMDAHNDHTRKLIEQIRNSVLANIPGARFSRGEQPGLAHNAHFTFAGAKSDSLLFLLDQAGIAASAGSACQAGVARPSHVLLAMGRSEAEANGTLRFTVGAATTQADIDHLLDILPDLVVTARA
ncbi:MAG: cysteine desulfurase family protein [Micrococcales bacterium]